MASLNKPFLLACCFFVLWPLVVHATPARVPAPAGTKTKLATGQNRRTIQQQIVHFTSASQKLILGIKNRFAANNNKVFERLKHLKTELAKLSTNEDLGRVSALHSFLQACSEDLLICRKKLLSQKNKQQLVPWIYRVELVKNSFLQEGYTSHSSNIAGEILQVLGRIVIKRATQVAFDSLKTIIKEALQCNTSEQPFRLQYVCDVFNKVDLRNIVTNPQTLMQALVRDLFENLLKKIQPYRTSAILVGLQPLALELLFQQIADAWKHSGSGGISQVLKQHVREMIVQQANHLKCSDVGGAPALKPVMQALWVAATCLAQAKREANKKVKFYQHVALCSLHTIAKTCTNDSSVRAIIIRLSRTLTAMLSIDQRQLHGKEAIEKVAKPIIQFFFYVLRDSVEKSNHPKKAELVNIVNGLEEIMMGLAAKDWVQVSAGASNAIEAAVPLLISGAQATTFKQKYKKFFRLAAAIGQYAATYSQSVPGKKEDPQLARQNIIENLIDSLSNRSGRTSGVVFSIGGSFGLFGGALLSNGTTEKPVNVAFQGPFSLNLGFALQTFHEWTGGFHLQFSIFDLGRYVTFTGVNGEVAVPNVQDAVSIGITIGGWIYPNNAPIFIGLHGGISPFVIRNKFPVGYIGAMVGVYVPFFDFN